MAKRKKGYHRTDTIISKRGYDRKEKGYDYGKRKGYDGKETGLWKEGKKRAMKARKKRGYDSSKQKKRLWQKRKAAFPTAVIDHTRVDPRRKGRCTTRVQHDAIVSVARFSCMKNADKKRSFFVPRLSLVSQKSTLQSMILPSCCIHLNIASLEVAYSYFVHITQVFITSKREVTAFDDKTRCPHRTPATWDQKPPKGHNIRRGPSVVPVE